MAARRANAGVSPVRSDQALSDTDGCSSGKPGVGCPPPGFTFCRHCVTNVREMLTEVSVLHSIKEDPDRGTFKIFVFMRGDKSRGK